MMICRKVKIVEVSRVLYGSLLMVYPKELRGRFGEEMEIVFVASLRDAADQGVGGLLRVWRLALCELVTVALPSRLSSSAVMAAAVSLVAASALFLVFFRAVS
jgi:hypothetical protein